MPLRLKRLLTKSVNLVLLCSRHHHLVDKPGWHVNGSVVEEPSGAAGLPDHARYPHLLVAELEPRPQALVWGTTSLGGGRYRADTPGVRVRGFRVSGQGRLRAPRQGEPVTDERVSVSRTMRASAAEIFKIVSHPEGHVDIDGSGMLETAPDAKPLTAVGDTFAMDMDREPLGDVPMGKYSVLNIVTQIVPDELVEWTVGSAERSPLGHLYGWSLKPVGDGATEVTNYCDWSKIPEKLKDRISWPVVPATMLERSLDNLERIVTKPGS